MKAYRLLPRSLALVACMLVTCASWPASAAFPRVRPASPQPAGPGKSETPDTADVPRQPAAEAGRASDTAAASVTGGATVVRDVVVEHGNVTVARGEKVADVAVTFGKARVDGEVTGDLVVTFGNVEMEGEVHGDLVVVFGGAKVSGTVHGKAVAVGGTLTLEEGAHVKGDAVGLGGGVRRAEGARVDGKLVSKGLEVLPEGLRARARAFFEECVLLVRPLSLKVDFVWWLWGGLLAIEALLALLFPSAVRGIMATLRERPLASVFAGLAAIPAGMLVGVTLSATVVLAPVVLFLFAAACVGAALGEASFIRLLGASLLRWARPSPLVGGAEFVLGAALLTGLMLVPVLGLMVWAAMDLWVLGAVLLTLAGGRKRAVTPSSAAPPTPTAPSASSAAPGQGLGPTGVFAPASPTMPEVVPSVEAFAPPVARTAAGASDAMPPAPEAARPPVPGFVETLVGTESPKMTTTHDAVAPSGTPPTAHATPPPLTHRWQDADPGPGLDEEALANASYPTLSRRMGALVVDWMPLLVLAAKVPDAWSSPVRGGGAIAYFALMLAWRGTTLGGMVAGLRVVRVDGRPMDRPTAVVRALAAILSVLSGGLGWLWGSWDARRQTWHDRIAGTVVVRDDTGRSLV